MLDPDDGHCLATMRVSEKYAIDKSHECVRVFRTTDPAHPGVRMVMEQPPVNLADGGTIRDGHNTELDQLRDISRNSRQYIAAIEKAAKAAAATRVITWQIAEEMRKQGITKTQMAERMQTSRAQVDRILKAKGNVTIETLQRAAALVGRELRLELV